MMNSNVITIFIGSCSAIILLAINYKRNDIFNTREIEDRDYEKKFIYLVSRIDKGNINWTQTALRMMKEGYEHYDQNPRAMSTLDLLEDAVENSDVLVIEFIKDCSLM